VTNRAAQAIIDTAGDTSPETSLLRCYQCQKCSSGCPIAGASDLKPHELVRLVQLDLRDQALRSRFIWECTSCQTCATRCPQGVELPAAIDALRREARAGDRLTPETALPAFNDIFLSLVRRMGRVHEISLLAAFKLRTLRLRSGQARGFAQDLTKFPLMLWKRKIALLPVWVRQRADRERIFEGSQGRSK
jgi:heterodisulfide reductase subunit C